MEWKEKPKHPYFVGEYQEVPPASEDGLQECDFILTGWTRGSWTDLEAAKEKIENYFDRINGKTTMAEKSAVVIFYDSGFAVPTGEAELKKIEIHLDVKEWKVN